MKRKEFTASLDDLEKIHDYYGNQLDMGEALKDYFEEAFNNNKFFVTYKLQRLSIHEPRTQKNVFLKKDILEKYNRYVKEQYTLIAQKDIDRKLSEIFASLTHEMAMSL